MRTVYTANNARDGSKRAIQNAIDETFDAIEHTASVYGKYLLQIESSNLEQHIKDFWNFRDNKEQSEYLKNYFIKLGYEVIFNTANNTTTIYWTNYLLD